jgi:hypothetical protein
VEHKVAAKTKAPFVNPFGKKPENTVKATGKDKDVFGDLTQKTTADAQKSISILKKRENPFATQDQPRKQRKLFE